MFQTLLNAFQETLFMILSAGFLSILLGLPLGFLIFKQQNNRGHLFQLFKIIVQATKSTPYLIVMLALIPLVQFLMDHTVETPLDPTMIAIIPLTLSSVPFFSRALANALHTVPKGLIEAAQSMGATPLQILHKILIPEALPYIIKSFTQTLIQLTGFSFLVGALGYGGLGQLAIPKGFATLDMPYLIITLVILILMIQVIQRSGAYLSHGTIKPNL